jgi:hypothetical protein
MQLTQRNKVTAVTSAMFNKVVENKDQEEKLILETKQQM